MLQSPSVLCWSPIMPYISYYCPLKQSMDFLTETPIAAFERDLSSRVQGALQLSETAGERCTLSSRLQLLSSPALRSPPGQKPIWCTGLSIYRICLTIISR